MTSKFQEEMYESLISLTEKRLKRHSYNYSESQRKASSSLSDIKAKHKYSQSFKNLHEPKFKTQIHQNRKTKLRRFSNLKQDTSKFIDYIKLLKKRRCSHFILPRNSRSNEKNQNKNFLSLLNKNRKKNSLEFCMQNKKNYHETIAKQKQGKQINKIVLQQGIKVFPSLNSKQTTPNNYKAIKRSTPKMLSIQQLKVKMEAKTNKKIKLSIIDDQQKTKNVQIYVNDFINTQYYSQTLKANKFLKKQNQFHQQKTIKKQTKIFENKNKKPHSTIYKILPNSFSFKQPKKLESPFSPWSSKTQNFIDILG